MKRWLPKASLFAVLSLGLVSGSAVFAAEGETQTKAAPKTDAAHDKMMAEMQKADSQKASLEMSLSVVSGCSVANTSGGISMWPLLAQLNKC